MRATAFWRAVTVDETNLLERFLDVLRDLGIRYCVVGGQAVNAYADPVVSLDLDVVVAAEHRAAVGSAPRPEAAGAGRCPGAPGVVNRKKAAERLGA